MAKRRNTAGGGEDDGNSLETSEFRPFADDETAVTIGGVTIENGTDRVSLSGSLDIAPDQAGLEAAEALQRAVNAIVEALKAKGDLPERVGSETETQDAPAPKRVRNPFA
ncbi:hypothetical protein [Aureimonas phyllosphaerae]|uniref:Uncharacterized protein n=1 Tax=Aureimonas phyllosphaerae TaxID=1166078 RepID=A0A7W6FVN0_9HYPH|nr:hypothetical protein [Aureimonas phyllosphaerae]MBB3937368.1 hypothetical protein [Aureimonas phyllosphaerae]MBB3961375.1 hypothetical protein [Aureimonas phyllosphaerae]SFF42375.1 hypothetical protein SAMN05216566_11286 [Aureimonas phyllosphaerae]